jgi:hypothetical protein
MLRNLSQFLYFFWVCIWCVGADGEVSDYTEGYHVLMGYLSVK